MKKLALVAVLAIITFSLLQAQPRLFQGFAEGVSGKTFGYHSALPNVSECYIIRGHQDYDSIQWKTEAVPQDYRGEFVHFVWAFGMDVHNSPVEFSLSFNGKPWFAFRNAKVSVDGPITIMGLEGAELKLHTTMLDLHQDQMGFAFLKMPLSVIKPGAQQLLSVSTRHRDSQAWYMTFKTGVYESKDIKQELVVVREPDGLMHSVNVEIIHLGESTDADIKIQDLNASMKLETGFNQKNILLPKVEEPSDLTAVIKIRNQAEDQVHFQLKPVREWEIFLVQHTHTDIGYTRPQTEILPEHLRYIDNALDYCDQTDHLPDAAKFRWTIETSWSVREYLRSRPQTQIDRLLQRLKEGRLEATGMFFNFSETIDEPALAAQTKTLRLLKDEGIDVKTAMQNDVNGIAWCLVDYFHNTDVKYLDMGIHAHRARKPFNKPTTFWWQSPAGHRLLSYRSEHYQYANRLGVHNAPQDEFRRNLSNYLQSLEARDYPYDKVSLQFSGYVTDNSPPSTKVCYIIKDWNEKYEWPKLKSALVSDFLRYHEEKHAQEIPVHEVAWPDWWTDGVASAANETSVIRAIQTEVAATTAILSMAKLLKQSLPPGLQKEIEMVYDDILFYDEHTHGASESVSDPLAQNTINQWGMKAAYAWDGAKRSSALKEKALAFVEPVIAKSDIPIIAVFNTLNWTRSQMVELFIQYETLPADTDFTISDDQGREVPVQQMSERQEGRYYQLWVDDIPALGYKTLQINVNQRSETPEPLSSASTLENQFYKVSIDVSKGVVSSVIDKELGVELIDSAQSYTLGQVIYEQLQDRHTLERLTSSTRDTVYRPLNEKRSVIQNPEILEVSNGAIYQSIRLNGQLPVAADPRGVTIEIRLFHREKKIEFAYQLFKLPVYEPEGVYVAFPFHLDGGRLAYEAQGGVVYPGVNQLKGSAADWNTIQNYAAVKSNKSQILFVSSDIPLVHFGDLNIGRYYYQLKPKTHHIYSWVMNNYWVTNFKAYQEGELRWKYSLSSSPDPSHSFATRFGWNERVPVFARVISPTAGAKRSELVSRSLMTIEPRNLLLVDIAPSLDEESIILHLREIEGDHATINIDHLKEQTQAATIDEVNVLEEKIRTLSGPLMFEHFETKFIRLGFSK